MKILSFPDCKTAGVSILKIAACLMSLLSLPQAEADSRSDKILEWAREDLSAARSEAAAVTEKIKAEREILLGKIRSAEKETASLQAELSALNVGKSREARAVERLRLARSQVDAVRIALSSFAGSEELPNSSANLLQTARSKIDGALDEIFSPLAFRNFTASDIRGEKIEGSTFRIGAFRYFVSSQRAGFLSPDGVLYGQKYAEAIRKFASEVSSVRGGAACGAKLSVPADLSGGKFLEAERREGGLLKDMKLGGVWMWPILFFGIISLGVFATKAILFIRVRRAPNDILKRIFAALAAGASDMAALRICRGAGFPYEDMLAELVKSRSLESSILEEISYEYMLKVGERLFSGLSVLSVTAAVAPLFGLLGTVTGIIKTFGDLASFGTEQAQTVSGGISEALITTEYGLIVAIPTFVAHALFSRRAKTVMADMEKLASGFLGGLSK